MRVESEQFSYSHVYSESDINPEVKEWFCIVDTNKSGRINADELQVALINAQGKQFSEQACHLMINLFDRDGNGGIDVYEFHHLYIYVNQWVDVFSAYDKNKSGFIEEQELFQALNQMGYKLSLDFVKVLFDNVCRSDALRRMTLDEFIIVFVKIQRLTHAFRVRDNDIKGIISVEFADFVQLILKDFL